MEANQQQIDQRDDQILIDPKTYFQLIEKVGCRGPYQRNVFIIFFLNWFIASLLLMGTSFLFLNPKVNCQSQGVYTNNCQQYVCNLPQQQRHPFFEKQGVVSLATQFGPFHCDKVLLLDALRMVLYAGTFFGYIGVLFITDNYGRKFSIIIAWGFTLLGIIVLTASINIEMACVGLFLAGIGCQSCIRISMAVFGQIVDYILRQKYSVALQISFGLGQITIGLVYYLIEDWRWITIGFCLIPALIQMVLLVFYLEQTPKFAIKRNRQKAILSLNRIGQINMGKNYLITQQDIGRVLEHQVKSTKLRTPLDLCRFKSQRLNFFASSLVFFCITYLYFGPVIIVADLGLNVFVSQVILGLSQTIAYPISFLFIQKSPRKLSGYIFFSLTAIFFGILIFVVPLQGCKGCATGIIQIILVFAARFCVCYYFSIFFLYVTQIFPLPLRGIGFGMGSAIGALASTSGQFILSAFQANNINPMILFTVCAVLCVYGTFLLPETHKKPLAQSIPQQAELDKTGKSLSIGEYSSQKRSSKAFQIDDAVDEKIK